MKELKSLEVLSSVIDLLYRCIAQTEAVAWRRSVKKVFLKIDLNPLSANPTKWSNTLKQFVGNSRRVV